MYLFLLARPGGSALVTYFENATVLRTHLRVAALRYGRPGAGPRVGVNAVPTSFGSERVYDLRFTEFYKGRVYRFLKSFALISSENGVLM
jgi:hypothetical protein